MVAANSISRIPTLLPLKGSEGEVDRRRERRSEGSRVRVFSSETAPALALLAIYPFRRRKKKLEHDPEKWVPVFGKRSCSNKKLEWIAFEEKSSHSSAPGISVPFSSASRSWDPCGALSRSIDIAANSSARSDPAESSRSDRQ